MSVLLLLIPLSILLGACFLGGFIWAVRSGQYEDTCTPSMRLLLEERNLRREGESKAAHRVDESKLNHFPNYDP